MRTSSKNSIKILLIIILAPLVFAGVIFLWSGLIMGTLFLKQMYSTDYVVISEKYSYDEFGALPVLNKRFPDSIVVQPFVKYKEIDSLYFITQWSGEPDIDTTRYYSYSDYYRVYKKLNEPKYYIIDARKDTLIGPMSKEVFEKAKKNKKDSL